jgi:hypothetical protein
MRTFKFLRDQKTLMEIYSELSAPTYPRNDGMTIPLYYSRIPQYVIDCGEIGAYEEGWNVAENSNGMNPYHDELRSEIWNRGFWDRSNYHDFRNIRNAE